MKAALLPAIGHKSLILVIEPTIDAKLAEPLRYRFLSMNPAIARNASMRVSYPDR